MTQYLDIDVDLLDACGASLGPRQRCTFESANGSLANLSTISFVPQFDGKASTVVLYRPGDGEELLRFPLERPQWYTAGMNVHFNTASIKVHGEGNPSITTWLTAVYDVPDATFEEFLTGNPDATAKEIWEAGYVAGTRITHILLTGDAP